MRIVLKPLGAFLVIVAFSTLIGLLFLQRKHQTGSPLTSDANAAQESAPKAASTQVNAENLLVNTGFESGYESVHGYDNKAVLQGMVPAPWRDDSSWAHVNAVYASDKAVSHGGSTALKIGLLSVQHRETDLDAVQMVQELQLTSGRHYTAGIWIRADRSVPVTLTVRQAAEPFTAYATNTVTISKTWQFVKTDATVTQEGSSFFMVSVATPATVWVDDATLTLSNP